MGSLQTEESKRTAASAAGPGKKSRPSGPVSRSAGSGLTAAPRHVLRHGGRASSAPGVEKGSACSIAASPVECATESGTATGSVSPTGEASHSAQNMYIQRKNA